MDDLINYYQNILESSNQYGVTNKERIHQEIIETLKGLIVLDDVQKIVDYQWNFLESIDWSKYFSTPQRIAKFRKSLYKAVEVLAKSWGENDSYSQILSNFENEIIENEIVPVTLDKSLVCYKFTILVDDDRTCRHFILHYN